MEFKFVKVNNVWGLVIETLEQLNEYKKVVVQPKVDIVGDIFIDRINYNNNLIKNGKHPINGHWGDKLAFIASLEMEKCDDENMTVLDLKKILIGVMINPKQDMIEKGEIVLTFGFPFSSLDDTIEIEEKITLDHIPVKFVEPYLTDDKCGVIFDC